MPVLQQPLWNGPPIKGGDLFTLRSRHDRGFRFAVCEVWTHILGWELRLLVDRDCRRSCVCRDQDELFETMELWKAALVVAGWK
jgi:hypothetical protein